MASNIQITMAETLFKSLDDTITNLITTGASNLMAKVSPIFCCGVCIYFGLKAIGWYKNGTDLPIIEIIEEAIKLTLMCFCSFNVGNYLRYIVPVISELSNDICSILSNNATTANTIDALLSNMINLFVDFINHPDFSSITVFSDLNVIVTAIAAVICMIMLGLPFVIITCAILFSTYVGLKLFLVLGPLFIAFSIFPGTRDMFWGWLRLVSSFILINVLFSLVCTIEIQFIRDNFLNSQDLPDWGDLGSMIIVFGCFIYLAKSLPSFASSVTGGMGIAGISPARIGPGSMFRGAKAAVTGTKKTSSYIASKFGSKIKPG